MPRIIDIVIRGSDQSGPAFASAATNLARLTTGTAPAVTGLARIETQAHETGSAIITLGIAGSTTNTRMRSLTVSIQNQEDALQLQELVLRRVRAAHDADSEAVVRAENRYRSLNRTLENNRARMEDLKRSSDVSGITVRGGGEAAAASVERTIGGVALAEGRLASAYIGLQVAQRGTQFITGALQTANAFNDVDTAVRALAGSTQVYNQALAVAASNQERVGGSMAAQLEGLTALLPLLRTTNAEFATLNLTQQLLGARTPSQGVGGAAYAIQELLSSDTAEAGLSLRDRFNLPPAQVNALIAQTRGDSQARLQGVIDILAEQGIDEATLQAQAQNATQPFKQLSAAWSNFMLREGEAAQRVLGPFARVATAGLNLISSSPDVGQVMRGDVGGWSASQGFVAPAGGPTSGTTVVNNYNVAGSLVTERQLADTTRRLNSQTAARNGAQTRR